MQNYDISFKKRNNLNLLILSLIQQLFAQSFVNIFKNL